MSVGGVLGGIFCALVAPTVFDWTYEHPILILAAALLVPQSPLGGWAARMPVWSRVLVIALALAISWAADVRPFLWIDNTVALLGSIFISLLALIFVGHRAAFAAAVGALMLSYGGWDTLREAGLDSRTRSYFGVYTITTRADPPARLLSHGTTLHGVQSLVPGAQTDPVSYYARRSGIGHAMASANIFHGENPSIAVVGLGTGTLSCYAMPGQEWRFYEIDPEVVRIARDASRFTFLKDCAPQAKIILGDARLSIAREPAGSLDILAVDAFSSDAVPMHLLTREALQVYRKALAPDGLLLIHISNRYLDLEPVLSVAAQRDGWHSAVFDYTPTTEEKIRNMTTSIWVAMTPNADTMMALRLSSGEDAHAWRPLVGKPGFEGWTDDHATILPILEDWRNWVPDGLRDVR